MMSEPFGGRRGGLEDAVGRILRRNLVNTRPERAEAADGLETGMSTELTPGPNPARITVRRQVEWVDTDMSGHYHNSAVIRWIEAAEAVLHSRLGIAGLTFGSHPRLELHVRFLTRLYFLDEIDISLAVSHVSRSSVRYSFDICRAETVAVRGELAAAYLPRGAERAEPWPDVVRRALSEGGDRTGS
jgi:acyl-CoA thioesterase FadM